LFTALFTSSQGPVQTMFNKSQKPPSPASYWDENSVAKLALIDGPRFHYSPLDPNVDGIRLVILEPSPEHFSTIKCRLRHVTFRERPKYEALSYTWGDQATQGEISIQGQVFRVGLNLLEALRFLRDPEKERVVWIDAICINQDDIQEKNRQIAIMPYIYTRAQLVLVWLGVPRASLLAMIAGSGPPSLKQLKDTIEGCWSNLFGNMFTDHKGLLKAMCDEAYWSRLWIIQESEYKRLLLPIKSFGLLGTASQSKPALHWAQFTVADFMSSKPRPQGPDLLRIPYRRMESFHPSN
jgi:hypothetical protein